MFLHLSAKCTFRRHSFEAKKGIRQEGKLFRYSFNIALVIYEFAAAKGLV